MGAFLTVISLVFGIWLIFPGISLIITALVGVTAESRRGGHVCTPASIRSPPIAAACRTVTRWWPTLSLNG